MKTTTYIVLVYVLAATLALSTAACGRQIAPLQCLSTGIVKAAGYSFQSSDKGIFIKGTTWQSDTKADDCGQVLNATLTSSDGKVVIVVVDGVPTAQ